MGGTPPPQRGTKPEKEILNINRKPKPEIKSGDVGDFVELSLDSVSANLAKNFATKPQPRKQRFIMDVDEAKALAEDAMLACGVSDDMNRVGFYCTIRKAGSSSRVKDVIDQFISENRAGENGNMRNPAAVLTSRIKALYEQAP